MIARKTWSEVRGMTVAYTLLLELLLIPAVLLWPDLRRAGAGIGELLPAEFLRNIFRQVMSPDDDGAFLAYMAVQLFFKGVNVVGVAGAVLMGTGLVARERENQTLEFLLARPVSRSRILAAKFGVVAACLVVPIFLTSWSAIPLSAIPSVDHDLPFDRVTLAAFHNACFVLLVLAGTTLCSVLSRTQVHTAFWIGAVIVAQVAIYFVQEIRKVSLFRLSDFDVYGPVMAGNVGFTRLFLDGTAWVLGGAALLYFAADRAFRRTPL
jgi:ABC-2 type transport system permease protein